MMRHSTLLLSVLLSFIVCGSTPALTRALDSNGFQLVKKPLDESPALRAREHTFNSGRAA